MQTIDGPETGQDAADVPTPVDVVKGYGPFQTRALVIPDKLMSPTDRPSKEPNCRQQGKNTLAVF